MSQTNWEADKMLDVYIHDYLVKRNLQGSAKAFQAEAKVCPDPVAIDAPGGFLYEWWSVFWDIFIARTNEKHSEVAASYIDTQLIKTREQQQPQQQQLPQQHQNQQQQQQQMQMQQLLLQRHAQQQQQQRREGAHLLNGTANGLSADGSHMRQNPVTANALATKMYEERVKLPLQRDAMDDGAMKQRFGENMGQIMDPNHAAMLKANAPAGQTSGQVLHSTTGMQVQGRNQQLPGSTQEIKIEPNPRTPGLDGSQIGVPGSNQAGNNLTLKGWPLTGLDQLRNGLLQQQKQFQSPQPLPPLQMLTPQQRQLLLQAQQNFTSPSANDLDSRRLRMLLNGQGSQGIGKDGQLNLVGDAVSNVGSPLQNACPVLPRGDTDMLIKQKFVQLQQQHSNQQQQLQQHALSGQQSQNSSHHLHQQEKTAGASSIAADGSMSNSFRGNDQASKNQNGRKRKQHVSSSGPAGSSGTANTAGPSPSSAPSTPSTHTPGDVVSMPTLSHNGGSSKPLTVLGDGTGTLTSPSHPLWDDKDLDGSLDDNIESFIAPDDNELRDTVGRGMDVSKGFTFNEVGFFRASTNKVVCCHFSSDGKLLATGGHDKKAVLWHTDSLRPKTSLEEHALLITDVRFSPSMPRLATSSFDKTVRVWDADNPSYSLRTFTGHSASVMSLDFHPIKEDLICSCDGDSEIRYWSINNGSCPRVFKQGGTTQIRFQPRLGRYLAAASDNLVSILDVETQALRHSLQGHTNSVHSVCWDPSGELLASVSEDSVRVWTFGSGNEGECVHDLSCNGNKFHSCVFHPAYPSLLVIGCYRSLELWNMLENKTMTLPAHEDLIAALAVSNVTGLVASASHDKFVKIWK